jgi:hypothetical protein
MLQFAFESYDPEVYPAVRFLLQIVRRAGVLCDGAVADPVSQRYDLPENYLLHGTTDFAVDVRDVVSIRHRQTSVGWHFFTFGLQKFDLPEVEVQGCQSFDQPAAGALLLGLGQQMLKGIKVEPGGAAGAKSSPFSIRVGGLDRGHWEGISVLELIPQATQTSSDSLAIWLQEQSN